MLRQPRHVLHKPVSRPHILDGVEEGLDQNEAPGRILRNPLVSTVSRGELSARRRAHDQIPGHPKPNREMATISEDHLMLIKLCNFWDELDAHDVEALEGQAVTPPSEAAEQIQSQ